MFEALKNFYHNMGETVSLAFIETVLVSFLVGLVAGLLIWAIVACMRRSHGPGHAVHVDDSEKGGFSISSQAMHTFVKSIAGNFQGLSVLSVKIIEARTGMKMKVQLSAPPDAEVLELRKELRDMLFKELSSKLGISEDTISQIDFEMVEMKNGGSSYSSFEA